MSVRSRPLWSRSRAGIVGRIVVGVAGVVAGTILSSCDPPPPGGSPGCGRDQSVEPGFAYPLTVDVDGVSRSWGLHVPAGYDDARPLPVVLVFHGDAECVDFDAAANVCRQGAASSVEGTRESFGFEAALGDDALVVYVDGNNENVFRPDVLSWDTFRLPGDNPDFAAVDAILQDLGESACVDVDKTFATGFSGGAFFVHSLGCLQGGITALAAFEGGFEAGEVAVSFAEGNVVDVNACVGPPPAALVVQADDDTVVPPRYGATAADVWAAAHGCSPQPVTAADDECETFDGCDDAVLLCTPASADPPRTHAIWQPDGPVVAAAFFRRFF